MTYTNCPTHGNAPDYGKGCAFCANVETRATLAKGTRVQLHPATSEWMQGDRYGTVTKVGRKFYSVKMDRSGRTLHVSPENIGQVVS